VPNKWRDKKRQDGSRARPREVEGQREKKNEGDEGGENAAPSVTVEKNYKWFAPLHLDESQIILRRATSARARARVHPPERQLQRAHPRLRSTPIDAPVHMYYLISKDVNRKNNFCRSPEVEPLSLPLSPRRSVSLPFSLVTPG